ncbi:hypothetical protein RJT34_03853 [Clitoria ternatea]|uniref:Uncharacterized protein n=1 Tax=Clitoria ternatea TaxID=43366 RepID=A0AAN9KME1_CLITE
MVEPPVREMVEPPILDVELYRDGGRQTERHNSRERDGGSESSVHERKEHKTFDRRIDGDGEGWVEGDKAREDGRREHETFDGMRDGDGEGGQKRDRATRGDKGKEKEGDNQ